MEGGGLRVGIRRQLGDHCDNPGTTILFVACTRVEVMKVKRNVGVWDIL